MAIRNIVEEGDDVLRSKTRIIEKFDERLHELLDDMAETMYKANGVGLAAPQVGVRRKCVVVDIGEGLIELINPLIIKEEGTQEEIEGCLSCPGQYGLTRRPQKIKVKAKDRNGKDVEIIAENFLARAICHEIDHLDGIIFKDKAHKMFTTEELNNMMSKQAKKTKNSKNINGR